MMDPQIPQTRVPSRRQPSPDAIPGEPDHVDWGRVGLFLLIAGGGALVVGTVLSLVARSIPATWMGLLTASLAVIYMPLPLVAGIVVERRAKRRPLLIVRAWRSVRAQPIRILWVLLSGALAGLASAVATLIIALGLAAAKVPGAGMIVTTRAEFADRLGELAGTPLPPDAAAALPPVGVLLVLLLVQGAIAGATINALFAFGEEYGWRGVLAEELAPLGRIRSHLLIGVAWGLWHAPVIVGLGYNFGEHWFAGIWLMVAWCVPLGYILAWAAARHGVFAAAVAHGVVNGTAAITTLALVGASTLVVPVGIAAAIGAAAVAVVLWKGFPPGTLPGSSMTPAPPQVAESPTGSGAA